MVEQVQRWLPRARRALFEIYRQQAASSWIEADGQSMQPLIHPGDWMLVEFGALPTAVGEIVLFSRGDSVVAHRVVAHRRGSAPLITKGDAEPYCDPPLGAADVLGVVRALRHGPHSPPSGAGCRGPSARAIARVSRWSGRGAALARRMATVLPDPVRRAALSAIPPLARVVAQALLAPICWAARIHAVRSDRAERR